MHDTGQSGLSTIILIMVSLLQIHLWLGNCLLILTCLQKRDDETSEMDLGPHPSSSTLVGGTRFFLPS